MNMLKDKNIVITGSNRGIGFAVLKACIENGANVFACMRSRTEELESNYRIFLKNMVLQSTRFILIWVRKV